MKIYYKAEYGSFIDVRASEIHYPCAVFHKMLDENRWYFSFHKTLELAQKEKKNSKWGLTVIVEPVQISKEEYKKIKEVKI